MLSAATFLLLESLCHAPSPSAPSPPPRLNSLPSTQSVLPDLTQPFSEGIAATQLNHASPPALSPPPLTGDEILTDAIRHELASLQMEPPSTPPPPPPDGEESSRTNDHPPLLSAPEAESNRASFLASFLTAALTSPSQPPTPHKSTEEAMARTAGALHFAASYVSMLTTGTFVPSDHSVPWAHRMLATRISPLCRAPAVREAVNMLAKGTSSPPLQAVELLLGYTRLLHQLTRHHRSLLIALASGEINETAATLALVWELAVCIPACVGRVRAARGEGGRGESERRGLLVSCSRLGYMLARLVHDTSSASSLSPPFASPHTPSAPLPSPSAPLASTSAPLRSPAPLRSTGATLQQLVCCSLSAMQPGDESLAQQLIGSLLLEPRSTASLGGAAWRGVLLSPFLSLLHGQGVEGERKGGGGGRERSLRVDASRSSLPLAVDWLTAPLFSFGVGRGGEVSEQALLAQLDASFSLLAALDRLPPLKVSCSHGVMKSVLCVHIRKEVCT